MGDKPFETCPTCKGDGWTAEPVCCGHWLADASPHGEPILGTEQCCQQPVAEQVPCADCQGTGERNG